MGFSQGSLRRVIWPRVIVVATPWLAQSVAYKFNEAKSSNGRGGSRWTRVAAYVTAAGAAAAATAGVVYGEAFEQEARKPDLRSDFTSWMQQHGGHMDGVKLNGSHQPSAGYGLFSSPELRRSMRQPWLGRRIGALLTGQRTLVAADVPLSLALTASNACSDPDLGGSFSDLIDMGVLDERSAVVAMLVVERMKGAASKYAPWLRMLPVSFSNPLWFNNEQLNELRGTPLAAAAATHSKVLRAQWERLRVPLADMLRRVGVFDEPRFEDFLWAYSAFWSRGQGLPVPVKARPGAPGPGSGKSGGPGEGRRQQQGSEEEGEPESPRQQLGRDGSGGSSGGQGNAGPLRIVVQEGIVPGLDFANHSTEASCWWEVVEAPPGSSGGWRVQLVTNRACLPKPGTELTINYGDKSNEELLMLYGFALPSNPNDQLMIACPLPPRQEWTDDTLARLHLLQARGLRPQVFLSAAHLARAAGGNGGMRSVMPLEVRRVLEVFVMEPEEVARQLHMAEHQAIGGAAEGIGQQQQQQQQQQQAREQHGGGGGTARSELDAAAERVEQLGIDMALVTTMVRLLELKVLELEGEDEGTGLLESDEARLADRGAALDPWLRSCLLYRVGQKRLARSYLAAARGELQETLRALQAAVQVEEVEREREREVPRSRQQFAG